MSNAIKVRPYPIRRDNRLWWVHDIPGKGYKVLKDVSGGATATTPQSQAQAAASALASYLKIAEKKYYAITGSVPSGASGGSSSQVTWQQTIPIVPAFCNAITYEISLPVSLTLPAGGSATLSPFAPYSAVAMQLLLAGAPPWPLTELTPWHIDETKHRINYDPAYPGLGNNSGMFGANNLLDQGPAPQSFTINPGTTVNNGGTSPVTNNYTFTFRVRMQLKRKRHLMWGAVPFGDPENRPLNNTQLYPLIGTLPEQSLFVNASNGVTCVTNGQTNVTAVYELSYIDLLPPGMQTPPAPAVGYGLQLVTSSPAGLAAGAIFPVTHRTAMLYTAIDTILVNGQAPLRTDYFGLWDDQDQQSARWAYDSQNNTLQQYWDDYHRRYRRYPYMGVYSAEFDDGEYPEIPSVTPQVAYMTPDASYAQAFSIPVTPAMTTAFRIAAGTALNNPYLRNYEWGVVRVPY